MVTSGPAKPKALALGAAGFMAAAAGGAISKLSSATAKLTGPTAEKEVETESEVAEMLVRCHHATTLRLVTCLRRTTPVHPHAAGGGNRARKRHAWLEQRAALTSHDPQIERGLPLRRSMASMTQIVPETWTWGEGR